MEHDFANHTDKNEQIEPYEFGTNIKFDEKKIISITYKILDFFPEGDPLKKRTKEKILDISEKLTLISNTQEWGSFKKEETIYLLLEDIEILENYLEIAKYQGWINSVNFFIVKKEYKRIIDKLGVLIEKNKTFLQNIQKKPSLDANSKIKEELIREPKKTKHKSASRQDKILKILSEQGKAQVSDIIKDLPNVTKRTIRRDLDDLLKKGKIVRVGEWNQVFYRILE